VSDHRALAHPRSAELIIQGASDLLGLLRLS
jgi:hypothetical protein